MPDSISADVAAVPGAANRGSAVAEGHDVSFGDVLSALNPLQYLPVVGTIYRALTGDTLPEPMRAAGSMIAGGLMGGPIGVAVSAAGSLLQHVTGIDLDHVAHDVFAAIGLVSEDAPPALPAPPDAVVRQQAVAAYGQTLNTYGPGMGHA